MARDVKSRMIFSNGIIARTVCILIIVAFSISGVYSQQSFSIATCSGTPFNFIQPGAVNGTSYSWAAPVVLPAPAAISGGSAQTGAQSSVSQVLTNTTTAQATATYVVTTSNNTTFQLIVTVNPIPVLNSSTTPPSVCSGASFSYQPTSATNGTSFAWSRLAVTGVSNPGGQGGGNGNPNEVLFNTTINPVTVTYNYTLTANGCSAGTESVAVVVNPTPFLSSSLTPAGVCSGSTFNYSATSQNANTFSWSRAAVANISNPAGNGINNIINEVLVNTSLIPVTVSYVFTLTNNSANCSSNSQIVRVVINPVPAVSNQPVITSCTGNTFISAPTNVPLGTLYTWTTPVQQTSGTAVTGGSAVSAGQLFIGQRLTNNGATNETMRYTVTPNSNGCIGGNFFVDVNVTTTANTAAVLSNATPPGICSGATFNYQPASANSTNFTWQRFYNTGISQGPSNGTGNISEQLSNITTLPVVVFYAYTLTNANGCNNTQTVPVSVNPPTVLSSSTAPVPICSNTVFSYAPTSSTPGTSFSWTRAVVAGISNSAASGINNPGETLINVTTQPVVVTYNYSLSTPNGCVNNQNVLVTVNPTPSLTSALNPTAICSGTNFNYLQQSNTAGTAFNWSRAVLQSISNGPGNGTGNPSELLVNTSSLAVSVPYNYILTANGCSNSQTVTVVVNPTPSIFNQTAAICSNTAFNVSPANVPAATQYTWGNPVISPIGSITGAAAQANPQNNISQSLNNQTINTATATYSVSPVSGSCAGASFLITVTVNPVPVVANQLLAAVCSGTAFSHSPVNVPAGTTYTWSAPVQNPLNSLTGASAQPISQQSIGQTLRSVNNLSNTATYSVTPAASGCTGNIFTVTVPVNPVPVINNVIDTICTGSSFSIAPTQVPANTTYTWPTPAIFPFGSIVGGSAQPTSASTISQILVNATNNVGQAVYTVNPLSGNCAGAAFTVTVTVGVALPFTPNQTALICSGTAFDATPVTSRPGTTYTWGIPTVTPPGSVIGISAASTPQATISQTLTNLINVTDTVVYTILPYNTGCRGNLFTATVRVIALPKATITGNPVICRYPFDTLNVSFTGMGPWNFTFLNDTVPGTQTGITTSPYRWVVPAIPGIPNRKLQITSVRDLACFNNKDTSVFVQKVNPLPVGFITSLHGIYICNNIPDTLFVSSFANDTLSYQWTLNRTPIPGAVNDSIATLQQGSYNVTLTNQFGCIDTTSAPVGLIYITQPVLRFRYDSYCINTPIRFTNLTDTLTIGQTQWRWEFGDSTNANTYHSMHTYLRGGDHHVKLTATQAFCPAYPTSTDSTLTIQFPIPGITMPSVSAYKGLYTPIAVRNLPGYRYQWNPSKGIERPDSAITRFNLSATQQYLVSLISPAGCVTTDSVLVRVFDDKLVDILVPKSFTPNGDGINDVLYPYLTGIKTFRYFKIYNRYGKLMFETTNPDVGWNGSLNGTQQPMSIYIWIAVGIANDGSPVEKRGQTLLLR